jgi:hypothetical protein
MVVGDNHRRRIEVQGAFDRLAGMDFCMLMVPVNRFHEQ